MNNKNYIYVGLIYFYFIASGYVFYSVIRNMYIFIVVAYLLMV